MLPDMTAPSKVPFIALWSDEQDDLSKASIGWHPKVGFNLPKDERGVMWMPYGGSMSGTPLFSQVHPIRQKMCMEGPYCQVCGKSMMGSRIPWLLNSKSDPTREEMESQRSIEIITPPTCIDCQPVARHQCPHLREHKGVSLLVRDYRVCGVLGDAMHVYGQKETGVTLMFGNQHFRKIAPFFIARQLIVEARRFKVLD